MGARGFCDDLGGGKGGMICPFGVERGTIEG